MVYFQLERENKLSGPLSDARVTITYNGTSQSQSTVQGAAIFTLPDIGQCDVIVEADNHAPSHQTFTISQTQSLTILLSSVGNSLFCEFS